MNSRSLKQAPPGTQEVERDQARAADSINSIRQEVLEPMSKDLPAALLVGIGALAVFLRTLSPDVLYGDSSEFQTLAYTLGMAHPTGYSVYTLIAWLFGVLPLGSPAWRINLLSALAGAGTVAGVYLLGCFVTKRRLAAALSSLALLLSYTFWEQAIIAEVYTVATLWWVTIMLALWYWGQRPSERRWHLFAAALLSALGFGVHLYDVVIAPAALLYFLWTVWGRADWRRLTIAGVSGVTIGLGLFLLSFYAIDARQSVTGFDYVVGYPSGTAWGVTADEMQTPWQRLCLYVSARPFRSDMFPGGTEFVAIKVGSYILRLLGYEFGLITLLAALIGLLTIGRADRGMAGFLLIAFLTVLVLAVSYEPGNDRHIFYLPTYVVICVSAASGFGRMLDLDTHGSGTGRVLVRYSLPILLVLEIGQHLWPSRLIALADGKASFVTEHYAYPIDLQEPRRYGHSVANTLPDAALVLMDWQHLYAVYYILLVELGRTDVRMVQASPSGANGPVQPALLAMIEEALRSGRPVFADNRYDLDRRFNLQRQDNGLLQLSLR